MSIKRILDKKYTLGGGLGSWAKSFEHHQDISKGDVRLIGGILMSAYSIYPAKWFWKSDEVNWTPIDDDLNYKDLYKWMGDL